MKRISIEVSDETLNRITDLQARLRKERGRIVSQGAVVDRMSEFYESQAMRSSPMVGGDRVLAQELAIDERRRARDAERTLAQGGETGKHPTTEVARTVGSSPTPGAIAQQAADSGVPVELAERVPENRRTPGAALRQSREEVRKPYTRPSGKI